MTFEDFINTLAPQVLNYKKGDLLFKQGDAVEKLYFISSGKIKLIRNTIDGNPVLLHTGHETEAIAEASLFSEQYHCSAVADTNCEIKIIKKADILEFLESKPEAMLSLLALFARQVRDLRAINEIKNIRSANERILSYIRCNVNEKKEMNFNQSLKDIAHKIGLTHETFYRELKKLEQAGVLTRDTHCIKLL